MKADWTATPVNVEADEEDAEIETARTERPALTEQLQDFRTFSSKALNR